MTMAEELIQRGRLVGRIEGLIDILEEQLTTKFGGIGLEHRRFVAKRIEGQLFIYLNRIRTADTLEEVFAVTEPPARSASD